MKRLQVNLPAAGALLCGVLLCCGSRPSTTAQELEAFHRLARAELADPMADEAPRARAFLAELPSMVRRAVARAACRDRDRRVQALGIERLVADGYEDDAVPALAARVTAGDDLTGFGYLWAHEDDAARPLRMYVKIGHYLIGQLDRYPAQQRRNAERFLSDGGFGQPLSRFFLPAAEERLRRIEALARAATRTP